MAEENEKVEEITPKPSVDLKMLIIFGVIIIVAVFVATFAVNKLIAPSTAKTSGNETKSESVAAGTAIEIGEPIITNLADKDGASYIKINLSVEVSDAKLTAKDTAKGLIAPVRNTVIMVLRKKTSQDVKGYEGFIKLRKELKDELNKNVFKGKLVQVNISDFAVQQ